MSYKSWRPSSRRDRRRGNRRARGGATSRKSDTVFFVIAGIFALVILAVLIAIAINTG
jgi:hypothetical protein